MPRKPLTSHAGLVHRAGPYCSPTQHCFSLFSAAIIEYIDWESYYNTSVFDLFPRPASPSPRPWGLGEGFWAALLHGRKPSKSRGNRSTIRNLFPRWLIHSLLPQLPLKCAQCLIPSQWQLTSNMNFGGVWLIGHQHHKDKTRSLYCRQNIRHPFLSYYTMYNFIPAHASFHRDKI